MILMAINVEVEVKIGMIAMIKTTIEVEVVEGGGTLDGGWVILLSPRNGKYVLTDM
jgi:hypothetical protein